MRLLLLLLVTLGAACGSCQPTTAPVMPTDQAIYEAIVAADCMAPDPSAGVSYVTKERALNPPKPWMNCMSGGGTVSDCKVPCAK